MSKRRPRRRPGKPTRPGRATPESKPVKGGLGVRPIPGERGYELTYPRCVEARRDDLEEVHAMLAAGEIDVAEDELRWLISECRELLEAHRLLGEIAFADGNLPLARGHLGYAFEQGMAAIPPQGLDAPLPCSRDANRPLYDAGKSLIAVLQAQGETDAAADVVRRLQDLDPSFRS